MFSDGRAWSVGVDGGRKDGREFKLTQGEHLVRVTHESLKQRFVSCIYYILGPVFISQMRSASLGNRHHCCISVINNVLTAQFEDDFFFKFLIFLLKVVFRGFLILF